MGPAGASYSRFSSRTLEYNNELPSPHPYSRCVLDPFWISSLTRLAMDHKALPHLTGTRFKTSRPMLMPCHHC